MQCLHILLLTARDQFHHIISLHSEGCIAHRKLKQVARFIQHDLHNLSFVTVHHRINQLSGKPEAAFDGFSFGRRHLEGTILSKFRLRKKAANCKIIKKTIMRRRNYHVIDT